MTRLKSLQDLTRLREEIRSRQRERRDTGTLISIGMGTCGIAAGARDTSEAIARELAARELEATLRAVGCIGICAKEPLVEIQQAGGSRVLYANVQPEMVPRLIEQHVLNGEPVREWVVCRLSSED